MFFVEDDKNNKVNSNIQTLTYFIIIENLVLFL